MRKEECPYHLRAFYRDRRLIWEFRAQLDEQYSTIESKDPVQATWQKAMMELMGRVDGWLAELEGLRHDMEELWPSFSDDEADSGGEDDSDHGRTGGGLIDTDDEHSDELNDPGYRRMCEKQGRYFR